MCGVIGVFSDNEAARETYLGMLTLQHRGQDAAGILAYDWPGQKFSVRKKKGLVSDIFRPEDFPALPGQMAIGHTRYQTVGGDDPESIQPMGQSFPYGLAMAHNGNLVNYQGLKKELEDAGQRHLLTSSDLEILLHLFSEHLPGEAKEFGPQHVFQAARSLFERAQGGYAVVGMIAGRGLFAFRDPHGVRPLVLGQKGGDYMVASESSALDSLGFDLVRDVGAGEVIFIDTDKQLHSWQYRPHELRPCMFEWVYFANPQSQMEGRSVYQVRLELGRKLAETIKAVWPAPATFVDTVVPVPDTSRTAALSLAEGLGLLYREALIKNRYAKRSFILKTQKDRERAVTLKLAPVLSEVQGKKLLLVDDSIVRGTTARRLINLLREYGAKAVYLASTCPPLRYPCVLGIDFPHREELIAADQDAQQVAAQLGADGVFYLGQEGLRSSLELAGLCTGCLDRGYPVDVTDAAEFAQLRKKERAAHAE